jgi:hypothetical protein
MRGSSAICLNMSIIQMEQSTTIQNLEILEPKGGRKTKDWISNTPNH